MRRDEYTPYDPYGTNTVSTVSMTKKEYRKACTNPKYLKELKSAAIVGYILVGVEVVVALLANIWALADAVILLGLVLGMHLGKRKGCAIAILCYSIFNVVYFLLTTGQLSGWLWVIMGIYAMKAFSIADKEYAAGGGM